MRMSRVAIPLAVALLASPQVADAQQSGKVPRIGFLSTGEASPPSPDLEAFRQGLHELGYNEGANIVLEYRYAEGKLERLPGLAADLVKVPVNVIVTATSPAIHAARQATTTIPIVFAVSGNPLATGYVASLARPGGNVTGLSIMADDLSAKRLELLRETVARVSRIAVLWNPDNGDMQSRMKEVRTAAKTLGVIIQSLEVRVPDDFAKAFAWEAQDRADALLVMADPLTIFHRDRIVEDAARLRLPAIYEVGAFVRVGGLLSYGPSISENFRRAATYVDKILKGAKPADLPVEQPTKFELVINLKTAKALGLTIPQSVLIRADEVIQ